MAGDSDEELCDVDFPITDNRRSTTDDGLEAVDRHGGKHNSNEHRVNESVENKVVDEDAIIRCFNLSVDAHVKKRGEVVAFEPMLSPPLKDGEAAATTTSSAKEIEENKGGNKPKSGNGEWFPAPLPLPPWAQNIHTNN